jgi:hypothetical protein
VAVSPLSRYRAEIAEAVARGDDTEHTHRPALKALVEALASGVTATNEPKRVDCGAPDYCVSRNTPHGPLTIGHIEAKDVGASVALIEKDSQRTAPTTRDGEQLKRYRKGLTNLILTDYLEFRWYVDGERRAVARLGSIDAKRTVTLEKGGPETVEALLRDFLAHKVQTISKPKDLAERLARLTHLIRDVVVQAFETNSASATLRGLHEAFSEVLIPDLSTEAFADMFSQTIAYGLFAARLNHAGPSPFRRQDAAALIPKTNPFLRKLFAAITGPDLSDEPFVGFVDDLAQLLADTDMAAVLAEFGKRTKREDPIVHFYETFLAAYDPQLRKKRGVYYTPEPVVSYIVRSVDYLLRTRFGCPSGLADTCTVTYRHVDATGNERTETVPRVLVLDPACGTGTFLYAVVDLIREQFIQQGNAGKWPLYVRENLLKRLFGFELLMAPYAVAHLKLGMQLAGQDLPEALWKDWGCNLTADDRLGVYLTNTLEEALKKSELLMGKWISDEANAAANVKRELPVLVVVGNPPYSPSVFEGEWIMSLLELYKKDLHETKVDLNREEWKFLRFAHWRVQQTGCGVVGLIINNTFLDATTHRQLRLALLDSFDELYVLDLNGSVMAGRSAPEGVEDQNVFDVQQGVTIILLVKLPAASTPPSNAAKLNHHELWGPSAFKYSWLFQHDIQSTPWTAIEPAGPAWFFVPISPDLKAEYDVGLSLKNAFLEHSSGIQTKKDQLAVQFTAEQMIAVVQRFLSLPIETARQEMRLGDDGRDWRVADAQRDLRQTGGDPKCLTQILYRPFDLRWTYYTGRTRGFLGYPRRAIMRHMLAGSNLGLISMRQTVGGPYTYAGATRVPNCHGTFYLGNRGQDYLFPLYLYPAPSGQTEAGGILSPWPEGKDGRRPNLEPKFVEDMAGCLGLSFVSDGQGDLQETLGPEDVFHYIYAVLHSPTYRTRYAEFLKTDFARIPLTSSLDLFRTLVEKGRDLVALHLLESPALAKPITRYPVAGPNIVDPGFPRYVAPGEASPEDGEPVEAGRVYINKGDPKAGIRGQYFEGVPRKVWEFWVGGYQPCQKWLKDRRGRTLSNEDIEHYEKMVVAINETIRLMAEIDAAIPKWPID